jgi:Transposase IS116/IS110/IS902 family
MTSWLWPTATSVAWYGTARRPRPEEGGTDAGGARDLVQLDAVIAVVRGLIGEIAGAQRFATYAKLARAGGIAPTTVSSGNTNRHRLDRGGNRRITTAGDAKGAPRALRRPLLSRIQATSVDRPSTAVGTRRRWV